MLSAWSKILIYSRSVTTCLLSRFILDLRHVFYSNGKNQSNAGTSTDDSALPSHADFMVRGGISLVGNIGAPLRTGDDSELEDEEAHISDDPFTFGLLAEYEDGETHGLAVDDDARVNGDPSA